MMEAATLRALMIAALELDEARNATSNEDVADYVDGALDEIRRAIHLLTRSTPATCEICGQPLRPGCAQCQRLEGVVR